MALKNPTEALAIEESLAREDVFAHLSREWNIEVCSYSAVYRGLSNWKWVVNTPDNKLFVKCYHPKRYRLDEPKHKISIARSLSFQRLLHDRANVCPDVMMHNGEMIIQSDSGYFYVVMEHFDGTPPRAGCLDANMMYRLGQASGRMHAVLSQYPEQGAPWRPVLTTMQEKWQIQMDQSMELPSLPTRLKRALERQGELLHQLDLSIFDALVPGWAHWDLWVDNILIGADGDIRLVDFDTVQWGYPEVDVARVILSGALRNGQLQIGPTAAFLKGYREESPFAPGRLSLSLQLLWCREAHWWLKTNMDTFSAPPKRFAEEMLWLTEHWDHLDTWLGPEGIMVK